MKYVRLDLRRKQPARPPTRARRDGVSALQLWVAAHGSAQALCRLQLRNAKLPLEAGGAGQAAGRAVRGGGAADAVAGAQQAGRGGQRAGARA